MDISLAENLLRKSVKVAEAAEVVVSRSCSRGVSFESSKLKVIGARYSTDVGLRIIRNGKVGVAATNDLRKVDSLVDKVLASSEFGPEALFEFPAPKHFLEVETYSSSLEKMPQEKLVEVGKRIIAGFHQFNSEIVCDLSFSVGIGESVVLNSSGLEVETKGTSLDFTAALEIVEEGNMLSIWEEQCSRTDNIDYDFHCERAKERFTSAQREAVIKTGKYPVIFTPEAFPSISAYLFTALNGKTVVKGSSRLQGKLGQGVFDERLTIIDEGLIDWRPRSAKVDSEGVPVRKLVLVENGTVRNFYYDLQSAAQAGSQSTGHGSRGIASALASPSLHNILIKEGNESYASVLAGIDEGILAIQFIGESEGNPFNGDFSMNLNLGYKVEKGEIVGRVKDTMIAGNAFDLLANGVRAISREREWVGGSFLCPYFVLEPVNVISR